MISLRLGMGYGRDIASDETFTTLTLHAHEMGEYFGSIGELVHDLSVSGFH